MGTNTIQSDGAVGFVSKFSNSGNLQYSTYFYEASGALTDLAAIRSGWIRCGLYHRYGAERWNFPANFDDNMRPRSVRPRVQLRLYQQVRSDGIYTVVLNLSGSKQLRGTGSVAIDTYHDAYVVATTWSNSFSLVNPIETYTNGNNGYEVLVAEIDRLPRRSLGHVSGWITGLVCSGPGT